MKIIKISIFLMIFLISCTKVKTYTREYIEKYKPDIKVKSGSLDNISLKDITLNILIEIKNNLPFELPIEKIEINLINNSGKIFANSSSYENEGIIKIPSNSFKDINMKCNAKYSDIFETAAEALKLESLKCIGDITLTFSVHKMRFKFNYNAEIYLLK
ncbi:hypothetical protein [uncultured Brachyspira sp.]|uniref:hypothetical protein n=1 Tax=uncultured Brachyspira sp. TaxID=221953 RepID=UPI0025D48CD8|nr:hypothetical protein [uncultured Brachyspira sp.]